MSNSKPLPPFLCDSLYYRNILNRFYSNLRMSNSKPLPPFLCDSLYYLNRDQLERFSIVCRPLKNFINRYFQSKPYRIFNRLQIRGGYTLFGEWMSGGYALFHFPHEVQWHPNRDDYSVQQFLAAQESNIKTKRGGFSYYSFDAMRAYLGPSTRIKSTSIRIAKTYTPEQIAELESISYLWRDGDIRIRDADDIVAGELQPILNSPTILQCQNLFMSNPHFSFKDYKVLYTVKVIQVHYHDEVENIPNSWLKFFEQPGVKPIIVLRKLHRSSIDNLLDHLSKAFSSAVSPNAFKIVFAQGENQRLAEFRETNTTSGEILELKEIFPWKNKEQYFHIEYDHYTLERSSI